ncbi:hypothetical protein DH2020_009035 [Rehmannia glutinosa]|uniref:Uncharacterized protein n=1 Tax=Rehmannia glutinosa TaxID=99300 RepID=A0ABR0X533_REHGL
MIRLLRSNFSEEQLQVPVLQFFKENLPNLSIGETGKDGQCEVKWRHELNHADERTLHASLLQRLSIAYPDYSAGIPSLAGGFEFSNKSVKTGIFGADKLQIRSLVFEDPSESHMLELKDGLQTPNVSNNRLSVGMTPKTVRLPKCGEMLLSVHGSPLGVYKEDNMETIQGMLSQNFERDRRRLKMMSGRIMVINEVLPTYGIPLKWYAKSELLTSLFFLR